MIRIHWSHKLDAFCAEQILHSLSADGLEFLSQQTPIQYNRPYASADFLNPLINIIGVYSIGFLSEAGKQSFKALSPLIKGIFNSLQSAIKNKKVLIKPGQRKFTILNICIEDLGGPRITFMFTDEDEEKSVDSMVAKAYEFIHSDPFQKHIKNFDQYSFQKQGYLKSLKLQFDKESQTWKPFDLSRYIVNGKLIFSQNS